MRCNGINHFWIHTIAFAEFCAEHGMCAFLVVIHGFTNIVQEAALFGEFDVCANFCRKNTSQF